MKTYQTPDEWYRCLEAGAAAVRQPHLYQQVSNAIPILILFQLPSFQDCQGWSVFHDHSGGFVLKTVVWRQTHDSRRFDEHRRGTRLMLSSEPTLESAIREIDAGWFGEKLAELSKISIPLIPQRTVGLDGVASGLSVPGHFTFEWWSGRPVEWEPLIVWAERCMAEFETLCHSSGRKEG